MSVQITKNCLGLFVCLMKKCIPENFSDMQPQTFFFFYYEKHIYQYNIQSNTLNELFFNYIDVNYLYYEQIIKNIEAKSERKIYSITNERYFACIIVINFYNSTKICKKFP